MGEFITTPEFVKQSGNTALSASLLGVMQAAAAASPYNVVAFSGIQGRAAGTANHPSGHGIDIYLQDPRTGKYLANYSHPVGGVPSSQVSGTWQSNFPAYEQFAQTARVIQQQRYPELNDTFRWGGYFNPGRGNSVPDLMHFDNTPKMHGAMGAGSWEGGASSAAVKRYGISTDGGLNANSKLSANALASLAGHPVPPADIPLPQSPPAGFRDQYLAGDGGLGYSAIPPLPRLDPRSIPTPLPAPNRAADLPPLPRERPAGPGGVYIMHNGFLPADSVPSITNKAGADEFYRGFGLEPGNNLPPIPSSLVNNTFASLQPPAPPPIPATFSGPAANRMIGNTFASLAPPPAPQVASLDNTIPPLPRARPDPLLDILNGGPFPTYHGNGPLPDPAPLIKGGSIGFDFSLQPSSAPITGSPINGTNGYRYAPNAAGGFTRVGKIDPSLPPSLPAPTPGAPSRASIESIAALPPPPSIMGRDITANTMPGADLKSLDMPLPNVPQFITIDKQVPIPSDQPIATGTGVHWDAASGQYVLGDAAPAATPSPQFKTVKVTVPNPAYKPAAPPPVVPLSPPPEELAALRQQAQNPLQRLFNATPLGHVTSFVQNLGQAPHYGAPAQGGLLAMLSGRGGIGGAPAGGIFGLLGGLGHNATPAQIRSQLTPQVAAQQNPLALAALNAGQGSYSAPGGLLMPTVAVNGTIRNSYGDYGSGSPYASNGSLSSLV